MAAPGTPRGGEVQNLAGGPGQDPAGGSTGLLGCSPASGSRGSLGHSPAGGSEGATEHSPAGGPGDASGRSCFSERPNLEEIRQLQAAFTDERDWDQFHPPRNLLLALVGEVGELAELFQWRGEVPEGLPGWSDTERASLRHELSDVLLYLVELSSKCGVDLPRAVLEKMELNRAKYPAERVRGSALKYTQYQDGGEGGAEPGAELGQVSL
ncbi:glutamyl-tRNA(Gln) amidotransferase subunit B, mitochondrial isoform X1 [Narcine bancroftii]|uniref:glutamyl-tRNA(Gln) amidotransferase subunit B, mitochondrial isoform X1 n=1 Tax=Narcine bancroftii TaxID=1343680 RepID=UPI003831836A